MKKASLIRQIISQLTAEGYTTINIEESSLATRLTHPSDDASQPEAAGSCDFKKVHYDPKCRFPLFHMLVTIATNLFNFIYRTLIYTIPGTVAHWFKSQRTPATLMHSARYNFFLLFSYLLFFLCCIALILNFYIRDILFFTSPGYSNRQGAMVMEQPLMRTHHMFLFNTARVWGNTGIELMDGDEVEITVSGGFFNSIISQIKQARQNVKLPDAQYFNPTQSGIDHYTSKNIFQPFRLNPEAPFGELLYRIVPEITGNKNILSADTLNNGILSFNGRKAIIKVAHPGTLQLSINDIILDTDSIASWNRTPAPEILKKLSETHTYPALSEAIINNNPDSIARFTDYLLQYPDICFHDNSGEILFNINVIRSPWYATERNVADRSLAWVFSKTDRIIDLSIQSPWHTPLSAVTVIVMLLLLADYLIARFIRSRQ